MNLNATLVGQTVAFAVFVIFCMKYVTCDRHVIHFGLRELEIFQKQ